jgi:two-component system CheB/CheR fusion protein
VLNNIRHDYEVTINEKNAAIIIDKLHTIKGIPLQINQLFYNLIGNALKFSREDKRPEIHVSSRIINASDKASFGLELPEDYCEIRVSDNGIGFEQEFADRIFVLFQRLHVKDKYSGTGIGLALCKKIVENHKGLIFAESKLNEGSTFRIILPV